MTEGFMTKEPTAFLAPYASSVRPNPQPLDANRISGEAFGGQSNNPNVHRYFAPRSEKISASNSGISANSGPGPQLRRLLGEFARDSG